MVSIALLDRNGAGAGSVELNDSVFSVETNKGVIYSVLRWHLASQRQGTASSKTRSEVRGGGKKPWKQKGTGRARAGTIRSPLWRGGAVLFGPKPRDYSYSLNPKMKKAALRMALSDKVRGESVKLIKPLTVAEPKTKAMVSALKALGLANALLVLDGAGAAEKKAVANIEKIRLIASKDISVFDILKYKWLVLDEKAAGNLTERLKK